jgi:hypothetical protein
MEDNWSLVVETHKDIDVERGDWFEVKGGTYRAANGIVFDHTVNMHLMNGGDD